MTFKYQKNFIHFIVLVSWLASFIISPIGALAHASDYGQQHSVSITPARPNLQSTLIDTDFDGLPDEVEATGWSNASGGPYFTNPNVGRQ